jgi:hypothetical protein
MGSTILTKLPYLHLCHCVLTRWQSHRHRSWRQSHVLVIHCQTSITSGPPCWPASRLATSSLHGGTFLSSFYHIPIIHTLLFLLSSLPHFFLPFPTIQTAPLLSSLILVASYSTLQAVPLSYYIFHPPSLRLCPCLLTHSYYHYTTICHPLWLMLCMLTRI